MGTSTKQSPRKKRISSEIGPTRYLVVGREGTIALGDLLSRLLRYRGSHVRETISFDHDRRLTLYNIYSAPSSIEEEAAIVDMIVCLHDAGLAYEAHLRRSGTLLLDASTVTRRPTRADIDIVSIPAVNLVQDVTPELSEDSKTRVDLTLSSLLGSIEAVEDEYPDAERLRRIFDTLEIETLTPFLTAVYRGYDWLQEIRMRGKSTGGAR